MSTMKEQFDKGVRRKGNPAYIRYSNKIHRLRRKADRLKGKENHKATLQASKTKSKRSNGQRDAGPAATHLTKDTRESTTVGMPTIMPSHYWLESRCGTHRAGGQAICSRRHSNWPFAEEKSHIRHSKREASSSDTGFRHIPATGCEGECNGRHFTLKSMAKRIQLQIPPGKLRKFGSRKATEITNAKRATRQNSRPE